MNNRQIIADRDTQIDLDISGNAKMKKQSQKYEGSVRSTMRQTFYAGLHFWYAWMEVHLAMTMANFTRNQRLYHSKLKDRVHGKLEVPKITSVCAPRFYNTGYLMGAQRIGVKFKWLQ